MFNDNFVNTLLNIYIFFFLIVKKEKKKKKIIKSHANFFT